MVLIGGNYIVSLPLHTLELGRFLLGSQWYLEVLQLLNDLALRVYLSISRDSWHDSVH